MKIFLVAEHLLSKAALGARLVNSLWMLSLGGWNCPLIYGLKAQVIRSAPMKQISLSSSDQFHGFNATLTAPSLSPFLPWPQKAAYCVCSPTSALPISSVRPGMLIPTPGSNYCVCAAHPGPVLPSRQLTLLTPLYLLPTVGSPGSGRNEGKGRSTSKGEPTKFSIFCKLFHCHGSMTCKRGRELIDLCYELEF